MTIGVCADYNQAMPREKAIWISLLALLAPVVSARAQSLPSPNSRDQVTVNLPQRVTVGRNDTDVSFRVLQPGEYRVQQVSDTRVEITRTAPGSDPVRVEAAATVIVTTFNDPAPQTQVILHRFGDDYYFDKIWLQGKGYGYLFALPEGIQARERERRPSVTLTGRYEPIPAGAR